MQYIQRIELRLKELGITAKKMLLELGYADSLISQWKKGSEPSAIKLNRIAAYIELSLDYILTGVEPLPKDLTADQQDLLKLYDTLTEVQKAEIRGYMKGMLSNEQRRKNFNPA